MPIGEAFYFTPIIETHPTNSSFIQTCYDWIAYFNMTLSGTILCGLMSLFVVQSLWFVRRRMFNFFYYAHIVLFLVTAVASVVHRARLLWIGEWWGRS